MGKFREKHGVEVRPTPEEYGQAAYANRVTLHHPTEESRAFDILKAEWQRQHGQRNATGEAQESLNIEVNNFEIYRSAGTKRNEYALTPLSHFDVRAKELSISGILSLGDVSLFVEEMIIENYSIEGYDNIETPRTNIYVQPKGASKDQKFDIWFILNEPAKTYRRFHEPFKWIATFGKHVLDFLSEAQADVRLSQFGETFSPWIEKRFGTHPDFLAWQREFGPGQTDYRVAVHAYIDYLYNQAGNLSNSRELLRHTMWAECLKGDKPAIKPQPIRSQNTIATPIVYQCFKHMYFGRCLKEMKPQGDVQQKQESRKNRLGFVTDMPSINRASSTNGKPNISRRYNVRDVVAVQRDEGGIWATNAEEWVAYITRIQELQQGVQRLFVLWLYKPEDTTISTMAYPIEKELFMSDHCNCLDAELLSTDVRRKVSVDWWPRSTQTTKEFLVRQKYDTQESVFVTLKKPDFACSCNHKPTQVTYMPGDSVYINTGKGGLLEPVVVCLWDNTVGQVQVRRLVRLERVGTITQDAENIKRQVSPAPNEVAWTEDLFTVSASRVERKCHLRFFSIQDVISNGIPTPYDRRGNGDLWYFSSQITTVNGLPYLEHLNSSPKTLNQSYGLFAQTPLRGLSIFSGGGNLDRGLEEGGAVNFVGAVDISKEAVHTQLANAMHPRNFKTYWGSVDDYLEDVIKDRNDSKYVARIGEVQFLAGGSPCQAFSAMQKDKMSVKSLSNASHVTTFCSFVDVFRPEYALLENVVNLANNRKGYEDEKVFSQLIGCLVALGYQVQQFLMDAWSHSSAQRRNRLFISIAAPGLEPIQKPYLTHSHPDNITGRSLGKLVTKAAFGSRKFLPTPFKYTSAVEASGDLPSIQSGLGQTCISYPDHRVVHVMNSNDRALIKRIPISPPGRGYVEAVQLGLVPKCLLKSNKKEPGKMFRRIKAKGLYPTITTGVSPQDTRCGNILHWEEHRTISVHEARDAQGVPDYEVIIGSIIEQYKVIGNGVDRNVALALGLSIRWATEKNYERSSAKEPVLSFLEEREIPDSDASKERSPPTVQRLPGPDAALTTGSGERPSTCMDQSLLCAYEREIPDSDVPTIGSDELSASDSGEAELPDQDQDTRETTVSEPVSIENMLPKNPNSVSGKRGIEDPTPSADSSARKKTRHSGLTAEFVPERWDKVLERRPRLG